jgi:hypothetical protein
MPSDEPQHLRLAGVTRLSVRGKHGLCDAFLFEPHRLALSCWALARQGQGPALLVSFDRHFDLVPPGDLHAIPDVAAGLRALDDHARWGLDVRNFDHILAAMEAGLVSDALLLARASPRGALSGERWKDRRGGEHRILRAPSLDALLHSADAPLARALIAEAPSVLLDVDLDCFTTPSDADPTAIVPWTQELIRDHLLPQDDLWPDLLAKTSALTFALEPHHCGGVTASHRLFRDAAQVLFVELLGADLP